MLGHGEANGDSEMHSLKPAILSLLCGLSLMSSAASAEPRHAAGAMVRVPQMSLSAQPKICREEDQSCRSTAECCDGYSCVVGNTAGTCILLGGGE